LATADSKRRNLRCQFIQVVQDSDQPGTATFKSKDLRAIGLPIGMKTDAGVSRFRTRIGVGHQDNLIPHQLFEKCNRGRMGSQFGDRASFKLDVGSYLLVNTIVYGFRLKLGSLSLESGNVLTRQEVGQDYVAFDFNVTNPLTQRKSCPVNRNDVGIAHSSTLSSSNVGYCEHEF